MNNRWKWEIALKEAQVNQQDVGDFLKISKSQMSLLVKKMIDGKGLTATDLDINRWNDACDYIQLKKKKVKVMEEVQ